MREINEKEDKNNINSIGCGEMGFDLKIMNDSKAVITVIDNYLKINYWDLYSQNNLEAAFKMAKENEAIELKMFDVINKFIYN